MSDEDLLERVAQYRDGEAFDVLYRRYSRAVYAVVWRTVGDRARSEDVAQDAFVNVWRAARTYKRERGSASGGCLRLPAIPPPTCCALGYRSREARCPTGQTLGPGRPRPLPRTWRPSKSTRRSIRCPSVNARSSSWRTSPVSSQSEVAEKLGLPLGTVKTRTRSALGRLSERLAAERVVS